MKILIEQCKHAQDVKEIDFGPHQWGPTTVVQNVHNKATIAMSNDGKNLYFYGKAGSTEATCRIII